MSMASAANPRFLSRVDLTRAPVDEVRNVFEMSASQRWRCGSAASLRHREMTVDPRLTNEKRWTACRCKGNSQSTIFRQPAVAEVPVR